MRTRTDHLQVAVLLAVAFILSIALFCLAPEIDLRVAALFFRPGDGFFLADNAGLAVFRRASEYASFAFLAFALTNSAAGLIRGADVLGVPTRLWVMVLALYLVGPGLVVNGLFKTFSGRARPADVSAFGGSEVFTPAWVFTDHCRTNCSFVSGEGALAAASVISGILVLGALRHRMGEGLYRYGVAVLIILGFLTEAQRMMTGRHFLSDTVFAVLIVAAIALALHRLLVHRREEPMHRTDRGASRH